MNADKCRFWSLDDDKASLRNGILTFRARVKPVNLVKSKDTFPNRNIFRLNMNEHRDEFF